MTIDKLIQALALGLVNGQEIRVSNIKLNVPEINMLLVALKQRRETCSTKNLSGSRCLKVPSK